MTSISQEQQAMSDESFQAELRAWLAANITDEFREKRNMKKNYSRPAGSGSAGLKNMAGEALA